MVIVDAVDINVGRVTNSGSDSLVQSRVDNNRRKIIHGPYEGEAQADLSREDGTVEGNIDDISKSVSLDFDQVRFTDNDNLGGLSTIV